MKLSATRDVLLKPLQAVIGVVERRQTMPILSNVLLVAKDGELSVTATDLEVELVAQASVDVQTGGEITVSGRKLLDICRALPEGSDAAATEAGEADEDEAAATPESAAPSDGAGAAADAAAAQAAEEPEDQPATAVAGPEPTRPMPRSGNLPGSGG